ncbi:MAG: efflux RND transporter periplasmic adaptor subunit [Anaerolineales bacterium]|nr:efflux RND transporter periplasmic adaptor subunit [Anaerolineales bacterium]
MKKLIGSIFILTIFLIASFPTVMPVSATQAVTSPSSDSVIASAKIAPAQISQLSFLISALVKEIKVKEGDVVQAGDVLITLNTPDLEYAVIAAEEDYNARALAAELQKAERVKYVNPNTGYVRWYPIPREVYLKALSKADLSFAVWESAKAILNQNTLLAPFNGSVVSIHVAVGELVQTNQVVLTLATLDNLQIITTDLSERAITRVKLGQTVNVYIEALDKTVTGKVIRISPIADSSGGDVVFPVTIQLDEQIEGLLWGMTAEVEIEAK